MLRRQKPPLDSMSFLAGNSEMARRIRERDWTDHPFGPPASWPQSLRSALSICLQSAFPTAIYWGPELRLLYNDAWAPIPGPRHPGALGAPAQQVWSDIWHVIEPQFAQLIATGEGIFVEDQMLPMRRFGVTEETYWNYSFTPIRGESGAIDGVFNSGSETTRNVLSQRQMQFLLDVGEAFRASTDPRQARRTAIEMLGRNIGVDRVGFREIADGGVDELAVSAEWTAPGVAPVGSSITTSELGSWASSRLKSGQVLRIDDVAKDPNLGEARKIFDAMGVAAAVAVPWTEHGRTVAVLYLHSRQPRRWTDFDVTTAEKVLERTLTWMERERAAERERIMMREIDHRARNALAVVQSVVRLSLAEDVGTFREKIEDRIAALARSHALLSAERWAPIELGALLKQELAPYAETGSQRVETTGPSVLLRSEQAQTVALLLHELTTNAVKHGALGVAGGNLAVSWSVDANGVLELEWVERVRSSDRAITPIKNEGFGSTLLNRVVEQQFGGTITRSLDKDGLRCALRIPLSNDGDSPESQRPATGNPTSDTRGDGRKSVLIVEDEAIVAMDLESMIEGLGYEVFGTCASVKNGLLALDKGTPDLAIVDMNLAGDSSRPIAEVLSTRGVPIVFASGYAELGNLPETLERYTRLAKPISEKDLARAISEVIN